ncbi:MAG TPA: carboxypeptidase regulatory-like domain-containing protein [Acidobacteriaceae bacterium]|nr:carboxypeptidase regulatory-like domain-containing protein [Acidobacteriaceae bacterium]
MPVIHSLSRILAALALCSTVAALAATPITGVVTNKTTNQPSAGDTVTLIRLAQGMQESTRTTTDARGRYILAVPDEGIHLVRVTHEKANYFEPAPPGVNTVNIDVYDAAPRVAGVSTSVEELHVEADANQLHIVEVLEVMNQSSPERTQFGPKGFDFFLPPNAHVVRAGAMRDQLPVPASAVPVGDNPGHYTFLFPIRPGETQFGILYDLPYTGTASLPLHVATPVDTLAVVLPSSITFTPGRGVAFTQQTSTAGPSTQTWVAQHVTPAQTLDFSISGTGTLPSQSSASQSQTADNTQAGSAAAEADTRPGGGLGNPLDASGNREPWARYKWWILSGLALLLAAAAGILLRRPASAIAPAPLPPQPDPLTPTRPIAPIQLQNHSAQLLAALKEELFALETDHLQQRISGDDYIAHKAALELVLRRALLRSAPPAAELNPELAAQ